MGPGDVEPKFAHSGQLATDFRLGGHVRKRSRVSTLLVAAVAYAGTGCGGDAFREVSDEGGAADAGARRARSRSTPGRGLSGLDDDPTAGRGRAPTRHRGTGRRREPRRRRGRLGAGRAGLRRGLQQHREALRHGVRAARRSRLRLRRRELQRVRSPQRHKRLQRERRVRRGHVQQRLRRLHLEPRLRDKRDDGGELRHLRQRLPDDGAVLRRSTAATPAPTIAPATPTLCGTSCVDETTDPNHCGGCATVCSGAGRTR